MKEETSGSPGRFDRNSSLRANQAPRYDPIEKSRRNPGSLRLAINAKCYDCEGRDSDPNWQARVGTCVVGGCPLWPVRPYRGDGSK